MYGEHKFKLQPETPLFSDAGMIPGGGSWLTPTEAFMALWERAGEQLTQKGFRLCHDGKAIGAPHDRVVHWRKIGETHS